MSLAQGTRLGPFEVQAPIGAGGMGEVYAFLLNFFEELQRRLPAGK
jgi:hypothetical protein